MENLTASEIKNAVDDLQKAYPRDLESNPYEELVQFSYLLNEKCSVINVAERYLDELVCKKGLGFFVSKY